MFSQIGSIIVALFGFFPSSELISELYAVSYNWTPVLDAVSEAVENFDSQALALMASPAMKKKFPDIKNRLDAMFAAIEGEIVGYEESIDYQNTSVDYCRRIITTENQYHIEVFYTAVDAASFKMDIFSTSFGSI